MESIISFHKFYGRIKVLDFITDTSFSKGSSIALQSSQDGGKEKPCYVRPGHDFVTWRYLRKKRAIMQGAEALYK